MPRKIYCPQCKYIGRESSQNWGSKAWEVFLWVLGIIPGAIYHLLRRKKKKFFCPQCGNVHTLRYHVALEDKQPLP